ncbi:ABC transporter substrate-binding protein [Natronoarchaeum rubrum]|uniref:ABC transporter substrate-binding protein n=1 Tax=Natronoarchaeum rubrum TaxID=755311 RepID=UPI0021119E43|nr:ABC transporter substrate-binding protein [Natronoarchaeum rubrum]
MSHDASRRDFLKAAGGAAVATTATAGCLDGGGGDGSGSLVYARGDHPENYDPQQTTSGEVAKVTNQIYDQLIQFEPGSGGQLTEGLATEYSLEGTTATLTLREGVQFHNGEELTAEDARATIRRFIDEEYDYYLGENRSGYGAFTFGNWVDSVDASSDYELSIELVQQYAPFLRNLAMFAAAILSQAQIENLGADPESQVELGTDPKGTGAFTFEELDNGNERVRLSAYDDYWGDGPNVDEVVFTTVGQNSSRVQEVINGDAHITDNLDSQSSQQVQNSGSASLLSKNGINVGYMAFNMERVEAFRNRQVRRAVSLAVNTEAIVNDIYQGFAEQATQPLPPDVMGHNDSLEPYPQDKQQAQTLLEEAGATGLSFELATFSNPRGYNPSPVDTANQVRSDLEDIGMSVEINQFSDFGSYLDYTDAGRHDACFLGWYTDNADPDNFMYVLLDPKVDLEQVPEGQDWVSFDTEGYSPLNAAAWANNEYMQTVREAQASYDEATRQSLYEEASQLAHDEAPWVFIDYAQTLRAVNEAVDEDSYTVSSVGGPYLEMVSLN